MEPARFEWRSSSSEASSGELSGPSETTALQKAEKWLDCRMRVLLQCYGGIEPIFEKIDLLWNLLMWHTDKEFKIYLFKSFRQKNLGAFSQYCEDFLAKHWVSHRPTTEECFNCRNASACGTSLLNQNWDRYFVRHPWDWRYT